MANKTTSMSKVRQIIKLYHQALGKKKIALRLGISKNTVKHYVEVYKQLKTTKEAIMQLSDLELNKMFHPPQPTQITLKLEQMLAFFPEVDKQMRKRGMTLMKLHKLYKALHPDGYGSSQFYHYYTQWTKKIYPSMHIEHKVGDKMYIDYAGVTLPYVDADTGEIKQAQVFVAILGWSQYAYVEAVVSQTVEDFITACENALRYFKGVPLAIVPDNLKSAVFKTNKYEPELNANFAAFAEHYGAAILPARARKPQDKAHVENMVKLSYQRIYTNISEKEIFSLEELNKQIQLHLTTHNNTLLTNKDCSRTAQWALELPALQPLPDKLYEMRKIKVVTVMKNNHVYLSEDHHYYSVPFELMHKKLKLHYSRTRVDLYYNYSLVASHKRIKSPGNYTTEPSHLPPQHQYVSEWTPAFFIDKAKAIDPIVERYIREVLEKKQHPEQAYKSCQGILSFASRVGHTRLINACKRAHEVGYYNYKTIEEILKRNLDKYEEEQTLLPMPEHENIRGGDYYK